MSDQPKFEENAFYCPLCNVYAHMSWKWLFDYVKQGVPFKAAQCANCRDMSIWLYDKAAKTGTMVYPDKPFVTQPDPSMPEDVLRDYKEAAEIYSRSPRGAAALLRLCLQKLCKHLGEPGQNINTDIRSLAEKNLLPPAVIKVADTIRIHGNNAVHPGEMSDEDFDQIAEKMFGLVNFIVRKGIAEPKELEDLYNILPEGARKTAEDRDAKARSKLKE